MRKRIRKIVIKEGRVCAYLCGENLHEKLEGAFESLTRFLGR